MTCSNGEQGTPKGETGIFYICKITGNACQFVKWCTLTSCFIDATNKNGQTCTDFKS
jgi:hypothetical protein